MVRLSVNVNKVATLRNARGGDVPSVIAAVRTCVAAGAPGITVHPRADQRHVRPADVREIAEQLRALGGDVEYNIEGDPRDDLLALVHEVQPDQLTLVPVAPGEITSQAGWGAESSDPRLTEMIADARAANIRVSVFVDPDPVAIRWAQAIGADRIELFTEPFARAYARDRDGDGRVFARFAEAAELAHSLGLGVNAGHDLDLDNLIRFRELPHLAEVSIGHALIAQAVFDGLAEVVRRYLDVLRNAPP